MCVLQHCSLMFYSHMQTVKRPLPWTYNVNTLQNVRSLSKQLFNQILVTNTPRSSLKLQTADAVDLKSAKTFDYSTKSSLLNLEERMFSKLYLRKKAIRLARLRQNRNWPITCRDFTKNLKTKTWADHSYCLRCHFVAGNWPWSVNVA